jgi:hypothetical protein
MLRGAHIKDVIFFFPPLKVVVYAYSPLKSENLDILAMALFFTKDKENCFVAKRI